MFKRFASWFTAFFGALTLIVSPTFSTPTKPSQEKLKVPKAVGGGVEKSEAKAENTGLEAAREAFSKGTDFLHRNLDDQAFTELKTALQLFKQAGEKRSEAAVHDALGDLYVRAGRYKTALQEYQSALELFSARNDRISTNLLRAKSGELYFLLDKIKEADAMFAQMDSIGRGGAPSSDEQQVIDFINAERRAINLKPFILDGQLTQMARYHAENMARGGFLSHVDKSGLDEYGRAMAFGLRNYEGLGEIISSNGGYEDVVKATLEGWMNSERHRGNILNERLTHAGTGIVKSPDGQYFFTQVTIARNESDRSDCYENVYHYRAFISYAAGEFGQGRVAFTGARLDEAKKHFENVLSAAGADSPAGKLAEARRYRVAALTSLGDVALRNSDYAEALRLYTEAVGSAVKGGRPDLAWAAQRGVGRVYWVQSTRENDAAKAAELRRLSSEAYKTATDTIGRFLLGSLRFSEARKSFLSDTRVVFEEASRVLAEMALLAAPPNATSLNGISQTYAVAAFQIVEQGRAHAILDLLEDANAEVSQGIPPALLNERTAIRARQNKIAHFISGVAVGCDSTPHSVEALEAELDSLEQRYVALNNQLLALNPRYAALTNPQPVTFKAIQEALASRNGTTGGGFHNEAKQIKAVPRKIEHAFVESSYQIAPASFMRNLPDADRLSRPGAVNNVLDEKSVLLEYSLGEENSYLWAVTRSEIMLYRLPARSVIEAKALHLRAKILPANLGGATLNADGVQPRATRGLATVETPPTQTLSEIDAYLTAAHDLYKVIVDPAAAMIDDKRLVIVADGALHFIPFETLITKKKGASYRELPYFIKDHEIAYLPMASILAEIKPRVSEAKAPHRLLIMADPVFDATDPRVRQAAANLKQSGDATRSLKLLSAIEDLANSTFNEVRLTRLKGSRLEAEMIVKLTSSSSDTAATLLDLEASETNLSKRDLRAFDILHFATHGILNPERPQLTGLALSLVGDADNDGFLRVDEVFNLRLNSQLVMLSACETGLGELKRGEGVSGFTRGFMYAGASNIGVSLWSVSDEATAELMTNFYKRFLTKEGASVSAALRSAQLELIAGEKHSAPFYWAPFVLFGSQR